MAASYITALSSVSNGNPYSLCTKSANTTVGLTVIITGTGTYSVQYCPIPELWSRQDQFPNGTPNTSQIPSYTSVFPTGNYANDMTTLGAWINHPVLVNLTATTASNIVIPTPTIRLVCTSYTSGRALLVVNEGSYPG